MQVVHVLLCVFIQRCLFLCWILWCWFEPPELLFKTHISYTEREFAQPKANRTHTTHALHTHTPSNTHNSHFGILPKWPHVIFPSTHPTLVALSLSVSPTHTHTRGKTTQALKEASLSNLLSGYSKSCKWHDRLFPPWLYTFNWMRGSAGAVVHRQTAAGLTGAF